MATGVQRERERESVCVSAATTMIQSIFTEMLCNESKTCHKPRAEQQILSEKCLVIFGHDLHDC